MNQSVFKIRNIPNTTAKLFFDESGTCDIQRYEVNKYPLLQKFVDKMQSFFWLPTEINLTTDISDFKNLTEAEEHIFTSNLKRQILLDSVQGRAPMISFGQVVSDPTMEAILVWWTAFEQIHSQSYTHIIRNVYPDPSKVFDEMLEIKEIVECGKDISTYYDKLLQAIKHLPYGDKETKRALWNAMMATNALEQIRFQVSFACTFAFGQRKLMTGTSNIVKLIKRDETVHCAITQNVLKLLPKDDSTFIEIEQEEKQTAIDIYLNVREQEKQWVDYLFSKGSMYGLTKEELYLYLDYLVARKMKQLGLKVDFEAPKKDPLPWLKKWGEDDDGSIQVAPQETEITNYQTGNIDMNISSDFDF